MAEEKSSKCVTFKQGERYENQDVAREKGDEGQEYKVKEEKRHYKIGKPVSLKAARELELIEHEGKRSGLSTVELEKYKESRLHKMLKAEVTDPPALRSILKKPLNNEEEKGLPGNKEGDIIIPKKGKIKRVIQAIKNKLKKMKKKMKNKGKNKEQGITAPSPLDSFTLKKSHTKESSR